MKYLIIIFAFSVMFCEVGCQNHVTDPEQNQKINPGAKPPATLLDTALLHQFRNISITFIVPTGYPSIDSSLILDTVMINCLTPKKSYEEFSGILTWDNDTFSVTNGSSWSYKEDNPNPENVAFYSGWEDFNLNGSLSTLSGKIGTMDYSYSSYLDVNARGYQGDRRDNVSFKITDIELFHQNSDSVVFTASGAALQSSLISFCNSFDCLCYPTSNPSYWQILWNSKSIPILTVTLSK
ncbi:MAG TPA: hypothetical protein VEW28_01720 [Candidatus Kapabacteria bacterium]|nr:hypothetical protein [Candidatus Kapabacteria bacterium]